MNELLLYLFKTLLISGLLFGYYWVGLRNAFFHGYNRFYLLGSTVIALILPLLRIPLPDLQGGNAAPSAMGEVLHRISAGQWEGTVELNRHPGLLQVFLNGQYLISALYLLIAGLFLIALLRSVFYILRLSAKYPRENADGICIFLTTEPGTPFSFFNRMFWNKELDLSSSRGKQVFRHELYHVRQRHTLDLLYMELLRAVCWFNPFFHLIRKELRANHEFLADRYATTTSDRFEYAELLVWQTVSGSSPAIIHLSPHSIVHSFFNTHLKRRITMLTKTQRRPGYFSRLLILPFLFLLFCAFTLKLENHTRPGHRDGGALAPRKTITVVIDPGHGGADDGAHNVELKEKDLNLAIAKKIQQLGASYNINVLMTRADDRMPGNKTSIRDELDYRVDLANEHKADLFVSIHTNNSGTGTEKGMEVWISPQNTFYQKSVSFGSAMIEELKKIYPTNVELKQREESIRVLQKAQMPAILLECGFMDNATDLAFIRNAQNQETIARSILQGILRYEEGQTPAPAANASLITPAAVAPTPAPARQVSPPPPAPPPPSAPVPAVQ